jgi:hypothetical protein
MKAFASNSGNWETFNLSRFALRSSLKTKPQVEYYFSDENLPTDLHLLQCCGGRDNLGVSIGRINGFKKMRKFKKKVIVEALRKSAFLEVSDDGKTVKREIAYDPRSKREVVHSAPLLPQKKAEYPPGMTKNMMKPTGFEDTFVECPIKPEEAAEEASMYDPDKPIVERLELAIQRFKQKRRMHEMYAKIFNKWMRFGGVEAAPRMFGGLSQAEMKEMNAEEIARATAMHQIPWDRGDEKHWVVDFVGVGEAFLQVPLMYYRMPGVHTNSWIGHHSIRHTTAMHHLRSKPPARFSAPSTTTS